MNVPPRWSDAELDRDRRKAVEAFRRERIDEPHDEYGAAFDETIGLIEEVLETTVDLTDWQRSAPAVITDPRLLSAFRYLAAPPISEDDLKTLAQVDSLSERKLRDRPHDVEKISEQIRAVLDSRRFPWIADSREPAESERSAAALASAALMSVSRVQTKRRTTGKANQEAAVIQQLLAHKLKEVKRRPIKNLIGAPKRGEFCRESKLGTEKADVIVTLWNDQVVPIECKVSNSALNSLKRLNKEAASKASAWIGAFGSEQIVPVAVLAGVYDLSYLKQAQNRGLCIIWSHDLSPLIQWIVATKAAARQRRK